jgi:trk system potassium uptake protein TrkH
VTGLTTVDTGTRFSSLGQAVILALIQIGGLGLMTFAVFVGVLLGRKVAFTDRMVIQDSMHHTPRAGVRRLVRYVLTFTLAVEAAGAALLWVRFRGQFPPGEAVWHSVFHSVSAFCNAGFGLLPDNLVRYRGDLLVNLAITGLIVVGGLGFLVNMELWDVARARLRGGRPPLLTLHTRLVLVVTTALLAVATVAFLLVFHRTIPHAVMDRALSIALLAWALVSFAVGLLVLAETHGRPFAAAEPRFVARPPSWS